MDKDELKHMIESVTETLGLQSPGATALLMGTIAVESAFGRFRRQMGGPALGIVQMEPATYRDIWHNYLEYHPRLAGRVAGFIHSPGSPDERYGELVANDELAVAMARVLYRRYPEPIPDPDDIPGLAALWKKRYNTERGKGTVEKYIEAFNRYCL